jgi:hypothetical protein
MSDWDQLCVVKQLTKLEGEMTKIHFPASGSLYLRESMSDNDQYVALDHKVELSGRFCIGPSCERGWHASGKMASVHSRLNRGPCEQGILGRTSQLILLNRARSIFFRYRAC